ncbi:hypothetical protein [Halocatena pleomorpha]|uniref:Uncharacterized protein n=1 Tax=Halocatena pleomorpha TaxID=1785090 RepID=A0A3P3RLB1_9EURY|nr:hypothetical protein [Halocatena pleomorpha]RRJ33599.1 hypothetical protein EIK79_02030 [Halocatena pleomorpha]
MLIWSREINADDIDVWIAALRLTDEESGDVGVEPIVRTTLLAMAASDETYTGKDLYRVFHSPVRRKQFISNEQDETTVSGRSMVELSMVDQATYSRLANRVLSCFQSSTEQTTTADHRGGRVS